MLKTKKLISTRKLKLLKSKKLFYTNYKKNYDAIIVGGGHNGLVCANYLAKEGKSVLVLERRHLVGGAAITEEIIPGFKFSRASYLCSLLRKEIIDELKLRDYGLTLLHRNPNSFTPSKNKDGDYLFLSTDKEFNKKQISKFSKKDAENYEKYEEWLSHFVSIIDPLLDAPPIDTKSTKSLFELCKNQKDSIKITLKALTKLGLNNYADFMEIITSPATKILKRWFESEPLLATLATDAVIGEHTSPSQDGSSYVLLHHVMGDSHEGIHDGGWSYVKGGMGMISESIAASARDKGVQIEVSKPVKEILIDSNNNANGVLLEDGTTLNSEIVISNCTPYTTFEKLIKDQNKLPNEFNNKIKNWSYSSATFKINLAVDKLPNFKCYPTEDNKVGPQHRGTIHFEENLEELENSYLDSLHGKPSKRPIIEMTIPSSVDDSISPKGKHVVQLFTQYAPYKLADGKSWKDENVKRDYAESCYKVIEEYCPGFRKSIIGEDLLSPIDLEEIFDLKGGSIFQGSMKLDQLYWLRPQSGFARHNTPVNNLYVCGASTHPGGGVMGSPGKNCANVINKSKK